MRQQNVLLVVGSSDCTCSCWKYSAWTCGIPPWSCWPFLLRFNQQNQIVKTFQTKLEKSLISFKKLETSPHFRFVTDLNILLAHLHNFSINFINFFYQNFDFFRKKKPHKITSLRKTRFQNFPPLSKTRFWFDSKFLIFFFYLLFWNSLCIDPIFVSTIIYGRSERAKKTQPHASKENWKLNTNFSFQVGRYGGIVEGRVE